MEGKGGLSRKQGEQDRAVSYMDLLYMMLVWMCIALGAARGHCQDETTAGSEPDELDLLLDLVGDCLGLTQQPDKLETSTSTWIPGAPPWLQETLCGVFLA